MCEVPHDYCPSCWGPWDFKLVHRTCPDCGAKLGRDVKLLVDSDVCPHCEEGKVTSVAPKCTRCAFEATPDIVWWGLRMAARSRPPRPLMAGDDQLPDLHTREPCEPCALSGSATAYDDGDPRRNVRNSVP